MVIFKEENLPPMKWKLARVRRLYAENDGICKVADFRTTKGIERRGLNKVCPLPDDEDELLEAASGPAATAPSAATNGGPPACI